MMLPEMFTILNVRIISQKTIDPCYLDKCVDKYPIFFIHLGYHFLAQSITQVKLFPIIIHQQQIMKMMHMMTIIVCGFNINIIIHLESST